MFTRDRSTERTALFRKAHRSTRNGSLSSARSAACEFSNLGRKWRRRQHFDSVAAEQPAEFGICSELALVEPLIRRAVVREHLTAGSVGQQPIRTPLPQNSFREDKCAGPESVNLNEALLSGIY